MRWTIPWLAAVFLLAAQPVAAEDTWSGQRLSDYLDHLIGGGLRIVYTSDLVTGRMRLASEPDLENARDSLPTVLRPFGLKARSGPADSILIVRDETPQTGGSPPVAQRPDEVPIPEIVVTSSLHRLDYAHPDAHTYLDRELVTRIPTTADEAVRLPNRLPGTASGGISSRTHVRGGEVNEVLFLFDGLRLYQPYHLKDFQAIASIVNANAVGGMDFYSGAYPVHYGDRMSGVLSIDLRQPEATSETELALSFFNASVLSTGTFGESRQGDWLVMARRGNLDLVIDVVDSDYGDPEYQDYLAHVGWEFNPRAVMSASLLVSDDELRLNDVDRGETATASYSNQVGWIKWGAEWSGALRSDTVVAVSDITNRRRGDLDLPGIVSGDLSEFLEFSALQLRQDWHWVAAKDWMFRFGFDLKDLDAEYRFSSDRTILPPFDSILDNQPFTVRDYELEPSGAQYAAYTELRWRLGEKWTVDLGLRWDQQNYTTADDDKQYSPRASLLYQPGEATEVRLGWGQYYQAQEINELQLSDGVDEFFPAQRAEHFVLNVQHGFKSGIDASVTIYRKSFRTLRPRFENAFNTLTLLPELQFDRVRIDPNEAEGRGIELMLTRGSAEEDLLWWLGYTWSEIEDETRDGDIKRSWDQTHAAKGGLSWRWGPWNFSAAGEIHTGWPRTLMSGENVLNPDGSSELVLDVAERNSSRYSVFHSFDVRVSRDFGLKRGDLTAFLEITNLYDRGNPCCTEYSVRPDGSLGSREAHWLPIVPSLGVVWRF